MGVNIDLNEDGWGATAKDVGVSIDLDKPSTSPSALLAYDFGLSPGKTYLMTVNVTKSDGSVDHKSVLQEVRNLEDAVKQLLQLGGDPPIGQVLQTLRQDCKTNGHSKIYKDEDGQDKIHIYEPSPHYVWSDLEYQTDLDAQTMTFVASALGFQQSAKIMLHTVMDMQETLFFKWLVQNFEGFVPLGRLSAWADHIKLQKDLPNYIPPSTTKAGSPLNVNPSLILEQGDQAFSNLKVQELHISTPEPSDVHDEIISAMASEISENIDAIMSSTINSEVGSEFENAPNLVDHEEFDEGAEWSQNEEIVVLPWEGPIDPHWKAWGSELAYKNLEHGIDTPFAHDWVRDAMHGAHAERVYRDFEYLDYRIQRVVKDWSKLKAPGVVLLTLLFADIRIDALMAGVAAHDMAQDLGAPQHICSLIQDIIQDRETPHLYEYTLNWLPEWEETIDYCLDLLQYRYANRNPVKLEGYASCAALEQCEDLGFEADNDKVVKEYKHARRVRLKQMLDNPCIYRTPKFRRLWEGSARDNIITELDSVAVEVE